MQSFFYLNIELLTSYVKITLKITKQIINFKFLKIDVLYYKSTSRRKYGNRVNIYVF